ncbi:MAG: hypothetical protein K6T78_14970 [Alicyclobacillus sp.]|nr:hypothetical protein [Alicyclobacillus sp.]
MQVRRRTRMVLVTAAGVGMAVWTAVGLGPDRLSTMALAQSVLRELSQGHLTGVHTGPPARIDITLIQPGDILLCHNPGGAYGFWTHAVLCVSRDEVIDADDFARGTIRQPVRHYQAYDEVLLLRPTVPLAMRQNAARAAERALHTPYDPLGSLFDHRSVYCSKLIWQAYADAGVVLCPAAGWVLPDQLAASPRLRRVADWKAQTVARQVPSAEVGARPGNSDHAAGEERLRRGECASVVC